MGGVELATLIEQVASVELLILNKVSVLGLGGRVWVVKGLGLCCWTWVEYVGNEWNSWSWMMVVGLGRVLTGFAHLLSPSSSAEKRDGEKPFHAGVTPRMRGGGYGQHMHRPCLIQVLPQQDAGLIHRVTQDMCWALILTSISLGD